MNETFIPASNYEKKKWYIIDCKEKQLGRLASIIVLLLSGKLKSYYHPSRDLGDYVILINAKYIKLNRKMKQFRVFKPGRPGHALKRVTNLRPEQILEHCIFGMMPTSIVKRRLPKRLKIYEDIKHPHLSQNPIEILDFNKLNCYM